MSDRLSRPSEPVVVTGLGTLGAWGGGSDRLAAALAAGSPLTSEVDRSAGYHLPGGARRACLVPPGQLAGWLSPAESRRMSPPSKLAVAASRMALRCAGLTAPEVEEAAVVIATAFGPSAHTEVLLKQILLEGPESASPSLFMESVANAPAAQIAIVLKARGASVTVCQREAGPLLALGLGARELAAGRARRVLAGAVDEMIPLLHALLDRFGALTREEVARPFDRRRSGFLAGEGAAAVVLESEAGVAARGGRSLARVLAWGNGFDPTAPPSGWGRGHRSLARSLRRTLERAGLRPADVDLVVSGASGAREGDRLEAEVLRALWEGVPLPPVAAPKAVMGEYGGGHLAAAVLAAAGSAVGPTPGFGEPDPGLGIIPLDGSPLEPPGVVLATGLAAGGAGAWVVLGKP
ncbi:MAG TPA: beta-ketoacyl synthase N-terminal-like domain-containing protein [Thermoanaerobaculia bacterium]|nr:beta-ketoacyl synthase N-terminal-like domain-containing protein [Thermoanaerobaculia bacterium]